MSSISEHQFYLIGISHKTAPVEIRERFSFSKEQVPAVLAELKRIEGISDCVVLSTCNRTELYLFAERSAENVGERLERYIGTVTGLDRDFSDHFYLLRGKAVIEHLFRVTSGLDSIILGETQIFGQVKNAYALACAEGCTGSVFNRLFHQAFQTGKQIRSDTSINEGIVSVGSAAVFAAQNVFGNLDCRTALVLGTGKIGRTCAKQLKESGIGELLITNRTIEHAIDLAGELTARIIPFGNMEDALESVDIIITSVSSTLPVLTEKLFGSRIAARQGKPVVVIDLGVPRNVEPGIARMENVHLFNIDDLEDITLGNRDRREREAEKAASIIDRKTEEYCRWLAEQEVVPTIHRLRRKYEAIRMDELKRVDHKVSGETLQVLDMVTRRIVRKILHDPTIVMRTKQAGEERNRLLKSIQELFINEPAR